jgi:hypothetical protein
VPERILGDESGKEHGRWEDGVRGSDDEDRVSDSLNYGLRATCADRFRAARDGCPAIEPNP